MDKITKEIEERIERSIRRYGDFASTHEAIGVALEEWNELQAALHNNTLGDVEHEAIDLAAVLIRLARQIRKSNYIWDRSVK